MAESSSVGTHRALQLLAQVLDLLLDPKKNIVDDTSLQRLAGYCSQMFSREEINDHQDELSHVVRFLEICSKADFTVCDPCTMTFALRLVKCLSTNEKLLNHVTAKCDPTERVSGVKQGLLVRLLQRALHEDLSTERPVKVAWLEALTSICHSEHATSVYQFTGALAVALDLLEDSSMFVVSMAQQFLATVLLVQFSKQLERKNQSSGSAKLDEADHGTSSDTPSMMQQNSSSVDSSEKTSCNPQNQDSRKRSSTEEELVDGVSQLDRKRAKLSEKVTTGCTESDTERDYNICRVVLGDGEMATLLACLLADLEPQNAVNQSLLDKLVDGKRRCDTKLTASVRVFQSLLSEEVGSPAAGLALLDDVAMVTRCRKIVLGSGMLPPAVCNAVVDLLVCILNHIGPTCTAADGACLISSVQSLPSELIVSGHIQSALQIAAGMFKFSCTLTARFGVDNTVTAKKMLASIVSPLYTILQNSPVDDSISLETDVRDALSNHMKDGRTALSHVCIAMSTLENLVKEGYLSYISPCVDVFHVAVGMICAVTPNVDMISHSEALLPQYGSLRQSRRVTIAGIALAKSSVEGVLDGKDVHHLFRALIAILNHPDTECMVILNALDMLSKLLPLGLDSPTLEGALTAQDNTLMEDVGFTVQKRLCSIESDIRDTAVECVTKLLQAESVAVNKWLRTNNLHKRLWESLVDSDSYVRASVLKALPVISRCTELWEDILVSANISQIDAITTVADIIKNDSEGFARRSAINCLVTWLKNEAWMKGSIQNHIKVCISEKKTVEKTGKEFSPGCSHDKLAGKEHKHLSVPPSLVTETDEVNDASDIICPEVSPNKDTDQRPEMERRSEPTVGQVVLDAVVVATHDLDWEVKSGALEFWGLVIEMYVPTCKFSEDDNRTPGWDDEKVEVACDGDKVTDSRENQSKQSFTDQTKMGSDNTRELSDGVVSMLEETECLRMLIRASLDEDSSVNQRACTMLRMLKETLHQICPEIYKIGTPSKTSVSVEDGSVLNEEELKQVTFFDLVGHLFRCEWTVCRGRTSDDDMDGPMSLMADILAATTDGEENLLDCY